MVLTLTREQVEEQVAAWEARLGLLYSSIAEWFERMPADARPHELLRGSILQHVEPLMERYDVPPRMLPTLAVLHGRHRVSFVPSVLWIAGANGRVNVTTSRRQFMLVDLAADGASGGAGRWHLVTSRLEQAHVPFGEELFRRLVVEQDVS